MRFDWVGAKKFPLEQKEEFFSYHFPNIQSKLKRDISNWHKFQPKTILYDLISSAALKICKLRDYEITTRGAHQRNAHRALPVCPVFEDKKLKGSVETLFKQKDHRTNIVATNVVWEQLRIVLNTKSVKRKLRTDMLQMKTSGRTTETQTQIELLQKMYKRNIKAWNIN